MSTTQQVTIGETTHTVQRFRGLKAILAMAAITRIAREVPDILADVTKVYQGRNTIIVTEAMSKLPRWEGFSTEDFDAAEKSRNDGKRVIELPSPMSQQEQMLQALPQLLEQARKEVIRLLAIMIVPNDRLKEADKSDDGDQVQKLLDEYEDGLLYDAELDQLVDLCLVTYDVLSVQLADRKDRLGKMVESLIRLFRWGQQTPSRNGQNLTDEEIKELVERTRQIETTQLTSSDDAPISSISSESTTDGVEKPLSTTSPGSN